MRAFHYEEIPAEPVENTPGVRIRWAIGQNVGAPNYVSRIIEIDPGAATGYHTHPWEHEVVVLEGNGTVRDSGGTAPLEAGTCVYVEPGEEHQFLNTGASLLRFVCVIPYPPMVKKPAAAGVGEVAMRDAPDHVAMLWHPIQGPPAEGPASAKGSYPTPVRCDLCAQRCTIADGRLGVCQVRENRGGVLYTLVYGELVAQAVDPIEKKPLFHFHPGSWALSIATAGCNLSCTFCQNADISQGLKDGLALRGRRTTPEQVVEAALRERCASIAYTYTEPTIFFEFAYDTGRLAHERGIANVWVSNGFMTPEMLDLVTAADGPPLIDAANIDLKAFTETYYRQQCGARLQPVLDNLMLMKQRGVWLEVTTLIIPGLNDSEDELRQIATFIHDALSADTPWHVSRFHPTYRLLDRPSTPVATLLRAREIGLEAGLRYVYTGNIPGQGGEDTLCPACGATVISRTGFSVRANRAAGGRCGECGGKIAGVGL